MSRNGWPETAEEPRGRAGARAVDLGERLAPRDAEGACRLLAGLYQVSIAMHASWRREERLQAFIRGARNVMGFDRLAVFLALPDGGLETAASDGFDPPLPPILEVSPGLGPVQAVVRSGRSGWTIEPSIDAAAAPLVDSAFVAAPLLTGQGVRGVGLGDNATSGRPIPPGAVEGMSLLCQQLATALEQSELRARVRAREHELLALRTSINRLASEPDMGRVLDQIARETLDALRCDASGIYIYDERAGGLRLTHAINLDPILMDGLVLQPGEGVAGRAFEERRPVWTRDHVTDRDLRYGPAAGELVRALAPRAFLGVPIVSRQGAHGALVGYGFAPRDFSPDDVRRLSALGDQVAIALATSGLRAEMETPGCRL